MTKPTPLEYAAWRESRLGEITERLERDPVGLVAAALERLDPLLGRATAMEAAFVAWKRRGPSLDKRRRIHRLLKGVLE